MKKNKNDESVADFLGDGDQTKELLPLTTEAAEVVTLEQIADAILPETEPVKQKRTRRKKSEMPVDAGKNLNVEKASMSLTLIGLTKSIGFLVGNPIWEISEREEADFLAESSIAFLDKVYPQWRNSSPYIDFIASWSSYFVKRIFINKVTKETEMVTTNE